MMAGNPNSNWWNIFPPNNNSISPPPHPHHQFVLGSSSLPFTPMADHHNQDPNSSQSWSQLLLGGLQEGDGEDDDDQRLVLNNNFQPKKLENLEGRILIPFSRFGVGDHHPHQEITCNNNSQNSKSLSFLWNNNNEKDPQSLLLLSSPSSSTKLSQITNPSSTTSCSSPKSSVNSNNNNNNAILDFSFNKLLHSKTPNYSAPHECASTATTGGVCKKARVQPASEQPPIKVRKEKVGDRITALHQMVSPFGKTDTASVLSEAIGYVRFLHSQIQALISPYLGNNSPKPSKEQLRTSNDGRNLREVEGENGRNYYIFPEDTGQLLNDNSLKRKLPPCQGDNIEEEGKSLRSRGLCLVPVSCTQLVQSDINGADYWAQAYNSNF